MTATKTEAAPAGVKPEAPPVWKDEAASPRKRFKESQRAHRQAVAEYELRQLQAGPQQFKVALVGRDGHALKVLYLGEPVDFLTVGAANADEAKGKFARYNGIHGGFEQIKIVG